MSISIIIPTYNSIKTVERAVNSVIQQEIEKEIIIVDDGSTDGTLAMLNELKKKYVEIKIFTHTNNRNLGASTSRNLGVQKANCTYIAFLDSDDYYLDDRFKFFIEVESRKPDMILESVKNEGEKIMIFSLGVKNAFEEFVQGKGWIHLNGLIFRKDYFHQLGKFNSSAIIGEDTEFLIRGLLKTEKIEGNDRIVAIRDDLREGGIVHTNKQIFDQEYIKLWKNSYAWALENDISKQRLKLLENKVLYFSTKYVMDKYSFPMFTKPIIARMIKINNTLQKKDYVHKS